MSDLPLKHHILRAAIIIMPNNADGVDCLHLTQVLVIPQYSRGSCPHNVLDN